MEEYHELDQSASRARSEEHVNVTKELFGIALNQGDKILMTVGDAQRCVEKRPYEDCLLQQFKRLTKELNEIHGTRYRTFDSDQMQGFLRV